MSYLVPLPSYRGELVKSSILKGVPLFNSHVWGRPLNSELQNLASKTRTSLYRVVHSIFRYIEPFRRGTPVWQTNGRINGRKDRQNYQ